MFVGVHKDSGELTSRFMSNVFWTEFGFPLDAYTMPTALLHVRLELSELYRHFISSFDLDERESDWFGPVIVPAGEIFVARKDFEAVKAAYPDYEFTPFLPD